MEDIIENIKYLQQEGMSLTEIATMLNAQKILSERGRAWNKWLIRLALKKGQQEWRGDRA